MESILAEKLPILGAVEINFVIHAEKNKLVNFVFDQRSIARVFTDL